MRRYSTRRPRVITGVLAATSAACALGGLLPGNSALAELANTASALYLLLTLLCAYACYRIRQLERIMTLHQAKRLLILAAHQDDCVISAGGLAIQNQRLGGVTQIVYCVQEADAAVAALRKQEAEQAWQCAGLTAGHLLHLDLLPALRHPDPAKMHTAIQTLSGLIRAFAPELLVIPLFEGGHIQHDLLNHAVSVALNDLASVPQVLEAPEYSPYLSLHSRPHQLLAVCARGLAGLIRYQGPPDGIDQRPVHVLRMPAEDLQLKHAMLQRFASQHPAHLIRRYGSADRWVAWQPRPYQAHPIAPRQSSRRFLLALTRLIPEHWVRRILPVRLYTVGREPDITDLDKECGPCR